MMKRCMQCILPENYPGIMFNEAGICNYCTAHKRAEYLGNEALKERIQAFLQTKSDRNANYDCILALSGGRDSTYLLYYLVKVLKLRVLAYFVDNGFIPDQTKLNIEHMVAILGVTLVTESNGRVEKCLRHHLLSFIHRPSAPMVGLLCTGCRLGMDINIPGFARKSGVPVIITGSNQLDAQSFKRSIMALNVKSSRKEVSFVLGYLCQVMRNPMWMRNCKCVGMQMKEYYYRFYPKRRRKGDLLTIAPFYSYIRWEEEALVATIKDELDWRETPDAKSTWRGDCYLALLKLYLYQKTLGFNDRDVGLSYLTRDGQISREEALERVEIEGNISEKVIRGILDKLGLDFAALKIALEPQ
jgi:tRNA(Ile)-lysidine synthase TilS/MesJ